MTITANCTLSVAGVSKRIYATSVEDAIPVAEDWIQDGEWAGHDAVDVVITPDGGESQTVSIATIGRGRHEDRG